MNKEITLEEDPRPCPRCGSDKYIVKSHYDVWLQCKKCGFNGPKAEKLHQAIKRWNRSRDNESRQSAL